MCRSPGRSVSLETASRYCTEVVGTGRQQIGFMWANVATAHIRVWTLTMIEVRVWGRRENELVDRPEPP